MVLDKEREKRAAELAKLKTVKAKLAESKAKLKTVEDELAKSEAKWTAAMAELRRIADGQTQACVLNVQFTIEIDN